MKLTRKQLRRLITEMSRIPPHIPSTEPEIERKMAVALTSDVSFINQATNMLQYANLTPHVGENYSKGVTYIRNPNTLMNERFETKVSTYEFKVTQSFFDAIMEQLTMKNYKVPSHTLSNMIGEWQSGLNKIRIFTPYRLLQSTKYSRVLRSDEPYVEVLKFEIAEPITRGKI
tara:strand:+ start:140 stop:658 length:519 start_codon:yes stop_codon:yes gene_type:complete